MISIEIFGDPKPQTRPRFTRGSNFPHAYDSQKKFKESLKWQIRSQYREAPLKVPVKLDLLFFMPIPKSTPKFKQRQMVNGLLAHTKKPDLDNLIKLILDTCNGLLFDDDSCICEMRAKKIYSDKPGTLIRCLPLADERKELLYENCAREKRG